MPTPPFPRAVAAVRQILADYCLEKAADGPIEALAMVMNVFVKEDRLDGTAAMLTLQSDSAIVSVNSNTIESGRKLFAIAHELGHFRLHRDKAPRFVCTDEMFMAWYRDSSLEPEANAFAAELLMPETAIRKHTSRQQPSRKLIEDCCHYFGTSLTATCFRYVESECFPCALFASMNNRVKWTVKSYDLQLYRTRPIGTVVDSVSCAGEFFETAKACEAEPQTVLTDAWFTSYPDAADFVSELTFCMPRLNMALSLVWPE